MCFSADASFSASAVLLVTGLASISNVTRKSHILLASTPIAFSIQQFTEGLLWLSFNNGDFSKYHNILIYVFVIFGQCVWPIWVPLSNLLIEKDIFRRKILGVLLGLGAVIAFYLLYLMVLNGVTAGVKEHHIQYIFDYPDSLFKNFSLVYLLPTVFSSLISSFRKIQILGILTLMAFLLSKIYFFAYVFSVWCIFAGILSCWIFYVIRSMNKEDRLCFIQLSP